jgi:hypothetical protein
MASTSSRRNALIPDLEAATERALEANDRLAEVGRKVTTVCLDGVEKYVAGFAKLERQLGEQTKVDAAAELLGTHAQLTEDVARASISVARELIAA